MRFVLAVVSAYYIMKNQDQNLSHTMQQLKNEGVLKALAHFYTPWKRQVSDVFFDLRFSDVFRKYRNGTWFRMGMSHFKVSQSGPKTRRV